MKRKDEMVPAVVIKKQFNETMFIMKIKTKI